MTRQPRGAERAPTGAADIIEIRLQRTSCFGSCPVYTVTLHRDGTARYRGEQFVERVGEYEGRVGRTAFDALAELAVARHFFELGPFYEMLATDLPSTITTVVTRSDVWTVSDYGGAGPAALRDLERAIDIVAERIPWRPAAGSHRGS